MFLFIKAASTFIRVGSALAKGRNNVRVIKLNSSDVIEDEDWRLISYGDFEWGKALTKEEEDEDIHGMCHL